MRWSREGRKWGEVDDGWGWGWMERMRQGVCGGKWEKWGGGMGECFRTALAPTRSAISAGNVPLVAPFFVLPTVGKVIL